MNREQIFPTLIIILSVGAAIVYAAKQDYYHARYWFLAAALNATVTY